MTPLGNPVETYITGVDKNIFLIPLSNGRLLTLYGNISPKSAVMIAKTIK